MNLTSNQTESQPSQRRRATDLPGAWIVVASLAVTAILSIAVDFNESHLSNPNWTGHARFHDAAMLNLLAGVSILAFWLMRRRSLEPELALLVGALVPIIFWSAFFWVIWALPGTDLNAAAGPPPAIAGMTVHINAVIAFLLSGLSIFGLWRHRRSTSP